MHVATEQLPGVKITAGPRAWQVLQREADGHATVTVSGIWVAEASSTVEVRVAQEYDNTAAPGCDWQVAEMLADHAWRVTLRVPTGGLYRLETRLRNQDAEWRLTGDKIWHIAVGDLWVIAGQSNAVGYGHGAVVDPPALGVSLFGGNEEWRLAHTPDIRSDGDEASVNRDSGWVDVSPWLAFGKDVLSETGVPIGLIPTALGGSPLSRWDPGSPDGADLYENMVSMIEAAGGRVAGMVWYQGCSDANADAAPTYLARFTRFVDAFRERYGTDLPIITAQLNRYLDAVPEQEEPWSLLREAQRQAARVIANLAVVPTLDLGLSDGIHNSAVGNVMLGQRFARAALGLAYDRDIPWRAVDVREARFADATRTMIRISFDHVVDHLNFISMNPADISVEDAKGSVPVSAVRVENNCEAVLELDRPAQGRTLCHNMSGCNPPCTLRDHLQRPVLAFNGVEVLDT